MHTHRHGKVVLGGRTWCLGLLILELLNQVASSPFDQEKQHENLKGLREHQLPEITSVIILEYVFQHVFFQTCRITAVMTFSCFETVTVM